jgi:hypothetical protein
MLKTKDFIDLVYSGKIKIKSKIKDLKLSIPDGHFEYLVKTILNNHLLNFQLF